jgi:hypothetical protein
MVFAQETKDSVITIDGEIVTARVENGDTLILAELTEVSITTMKDFSSNADYYRYQKYRRYASVVYPYAVRSIQLFREVQDETEGLKKRKARKHIRQLNRDVKEEFTDPLKDLNRTQGLILIKMIENAIDTPLYEVLKELRGGFNAMKWQTVGKLYGYDLREGYIKGEDRILDIVLEDYDLKPYFQ